MFGQNEVDSRRLGSVPPRRRSHVVQSIGRTGGCGDNPVKVNSVTTWTLGEFLPSKPAGRSRQVLGGLG